ncbi:S49 family peptidase [Salipiger abyssi]
MDYPQIAQRVFHTPLLAAPAKAAAFVAGFGPRLLGGPVTIEGAEATKEARSRPVASVLDERLEDEIRAGRRSPFRSIDGVAVIPVTGSLIHRGSYIGESFSGHQTYEGISAQLTAAAESPMVRGVALELDSFGGEVAGCFELADEIRALSAQKPVWAFISAHAFSGAYAIASQADRIIIPRSGGAGSIGVICMHADQSERLEASGVRVTVISAGAHKGDGNPYEPLPEAVREDLQRECEDLRQLFAETVAEGRGARLTVEAALATEARTFIGGQAVEAGLADEVDNPRAAFERFVAQINGRPAPAPRTASKQGAETMSEPTSTSTPPASPTASAPAQPAPSATAPEQSAPTPAPDAPQAPAPAAPAGPSAADERARISAILNHPEAKGREDLAKSFAFDSDMSAEAAGKHLAAAPKQGAGQTLSSVMESETTDLDAPPSASGETLRMADVAKSRTAK